jgi:phospholipid/cholesterol/gamma-HCH transport system permease protein
VLVFSVILTLVCCYYGYNAAGGPAGVGVAVGRAVRLSLVLIVIADFFLSLALWGSTTTVRIAG